jgi:nitrogen regulatory protein PII
MMKMIRCVLAPEHLPAFVEQMTNLIAGMTVWETRHHEKDLQHIVSYRGVEYEISPPGLNVEIVIDESWVEDVIRRVAEGFRLNQFTVFRLFVIPVEGSYHIRNGFMDT